MKNLVYRVHLSEGNILELFVANSNKVKPFRPIKILAVDVYDGKGGVENGSLGEEEIDSLVDFLFDVQRCVRDFNKKSAPETKEGPAVDDECKCGDPDFDEMGFPKPSTSSSNKPKIREVKNE